MKYRTLLQLAVGSLLVSAATSVMAIPRGYSNTGMDYLEGDHDLSRWSCGLYVDAWDRDVTVDPVDVRMETQLAMGYLGYDVARWITAYVTAGGGNTDLGHASDTSTKYGIGAKFNLLDHEIADPSLLEDRIRINGSLQYSLSEASYANKSIDFAELSGSLTLSILNDLDGNVMFMPNSIGLFAGAVYSDIQSSSMDENSGFGYTAGLDLFYSERITFEVSVVGFDDLAYMGGIHLRL